MPVDARAPYAKDYGKGGLIRAGCGSLVTLWEPLMALAACAGLRIVHWGGGRSPSQGIPPLPRAT